MLYGAEAVAYLVQRLYQSLSEEIAMALCTLPYQRVGKTNNISNMPYLFKCTAKQNVGSKVPKGTTIQVVMPHDTKPQMNDLRAAIKQQLGIDVKEYFSSSFFNIEKIK